eukprot:4545087-Pyramimonas_sp.AAC.1
MNMRYSRSSEDGIYLRAKGVLTTSPSLCILRKKSLLKGLWGVECTLAVIGTGGPVKRSTIICCIYHGRVSGVLSAPLPLLAQEDP